MLRLSAASPTGSWARIRSRTASATSECRVTPAASGSLKDLVASHL